MNIVDVDMNAYHPKISYWSRGLSKRGLHHNGGEWLKLLGAAELASAKSSQLATNVLPKFGLRGTLQ
jgi:hypothetical protein